MLRPETMTEQDANLLNPLQLAYIGDTVWDTMIRYELIRKKLNVHHMHVECVRYVNAHAQARWLKAIEGGMTEPEKDIARRGRNAHAKHPVPKNQNPEDYAAATGFEAVIGFWYLTGRDEKIRDCINTIFGGNYG